VDLLDLYERGSEWTASKIPAAVGRLDDDTPCTEWDVRTLLNHLIDGQRYFAAKGRGEEPELPSPTPPDEIGDDPVGAFDDIRTEVMRVYAEPSVVEQTGPLLGIAFTDLLIHGSDLARATDQDPAMPEDLAEVAFGLIDGQLTDDRRGGAFAPAVPIDSDANAQDRLLAYTGRRP
jgi:uncharacterized protein (TIGR03086 family)